MAQGLRSGTWPVGDSTCEQVEGEKPLSHKELAKDHNKPDSHGAESTKWTAPALTYHEAAYWLAGRATREFLYDFFKDPGLREYCGGVLAFHVTSEVRRKP